MNEKYVYFDRSRLEIYSLREREHDINMSIMLPLEAQSDQSDHPNITELAKRIIAAKARGASIIFMMGAHVIRDGVQRFIIDLMERGYINCVSANGACMIHDFEFAMIGATTESVSKYIREGKFGLWSETARINDMINSAYRYGLGMGEAIGNVISGGNYKYKDISIFGAAYRLHIPVTVHVSIGYDIIHEHPNFDGAAAGTTSYTDFLRFAGAVEKLEGGVVMNFGSAIMAPEVYLKALSMARNVAHKEGRQINRFTTFVADLHELPADYSAEPPRGSAAYYFRPWKTMLVRTVADGGESFYVQGRHRQTIPALWSAIRALEG